MDSGVGKAALMIGVGQAVGNMQGVIGGLESDLREVTESRAECNRRAFASVHHLRTRVRAYSRFALELSGLLSKLDPSNPLAGMTIDQMEDRLGPSISKLLRDPEILALTYRDDKRFPDGYINFDDNDEFVGTIGVDTLNLPANGPAMPIFRRGFYADRDPKYNVLTYTVSPYRVEEDETLLRMLKEVAKRRKAGETNIVLGEGGIRKYKELARRVARIAFENDIGAVFDGDVFESAYAVASGEKPPQKKFFGMFG